MKSGNWKELDLLEQRRKESNLPKLSSQNISSIRKKGSIIAYITIIFSLLTYLYVWTYARNKEANVELLLAKSSVYDKLTLIHSNLLSDVRNGYAKNENKAKVLLSKKSATALLESIRRLIPNVIKLEGLKIKDDILEIKGSAPEEDGLRNINSFMLKLKESSLFDKDSITLKRIWIYISSSTENQEKKFIIEVKYNNLKGSELEKYLIKSKAYGFANRVKYIRREGLIKWKINL